MKELKCKHCHKVIQCHSCGKSLRTSENKEGFMAAMQNTISMEDTSENLKMLQHHLGKYTPLIYKEDNELKVVVLTCHECLFKSLDVMVPPQKEN